jgi:HEAT repeat protein
VPGAGGLCYSARGMGIFDFITGGRGPKSLDKHVARAKNKDAQSVDRFASLEALAGATSDAELRATAVAGLLGRFTIRYDKTIEDEQEKEYVFEQLRKVGPAILPELEKYLRAADTIAWGLRLLGDVATPDAAWPILARLCEQNDNNYTRDPSKKTQLLHYLGEQADARMGKALIPYLEDVDEGVRFTTVEGLLRHKLEESRAPLLALLANEKEESRRIKRRIVEGMAELGWDVRGASVEKLVADLLPGSRIDNHGRVRKSGDKAEKTDR